MDGILTPAAPSSEDAHFTADSAPVLHAWGCSHAGASWVVTRQHLAFGIGMATLLSIGVAHSYSIWSARSGNSAAGQGSTPECTQRTVAIRGRDRSTQVPPIRGGVSPE